jgi:hypothetical protein
MLRSSEIMALLPWRVQGMGQLRICLELQPKTPLE